MPDESPIIILGAGRSGTNLLRDIVCSFDGYATWPCDEINYIWRHGNRTAATDELQPSDAGADVKRYVRRAFAKQCARADGATVVEKTCANSLRVGFVSQIFPHARYLFIMRDGRDVVASAMERWTANLDVRYLIQKARFVPPSDLPYYLVRYARARRERFTNTDGRLGSWGPRFAGMDMLLKSARLAEVCAHQWRACVESAATQLEQYVDPENVFHLKYEDMVQTPKAEVGRLQSFLGARIRLELPAISSRSVGRWNNVLTAEDRASVASIVAPALELNGYTP